jgi:hypothetical protein
MSEHQKPPHGEPERGTTLGLSKLIVGIAIFVLVGIPLVGYLWWTLNDLLAGDVRPVQLAIALPLLLAFAGLLVILSRVVHRWEHERVEQTHSPPGL